MSPAPIVETPRLLLRPTAPEDFDAWADFAADPETMRHLGGPQPRAAAWRGFATMAGSWAMNGFGMFSVIEKESGRWVGRIGPWRPEGWPGTEVGWGLTRAATGKGYGAEAASAAIDWAIDVLGWTDIIHCIGPGNAPSASLAERLGSRRRGPGRLPPPFDAVPVEIWGQSAAEWRARRMGGHRSS